jgi:hypothetical protein
LLEPIANDEDRSLVARYLKGPFWNYRDRTRLRSLYASATTVDPSDDLVDLLFRVPINRQADFVEAVGIVSLQVIQATSSEHHIYSDVSSSAGSGSRHLSIASTSTGSTHVQRAPPLVPQDAAGNAQDGSIQLTRTGPGGHF